VLGFAVMLNSDALAPVIVGLEIVNAIEPVFIIVNVLVTVTRFISAGPKSVPSLIDVTVSPEVIDKPFPCMLISLIVPVP
jgi:hypothetical protein